MLVLLNPEARGVADAEGWREAVEGLEDAEIRATAGEEEARARIREAVAAGVQRIVAAGGDGTVNCVVNGLAEADGLERVSLGILPLGTANDYARSLRLPLAPAEAVEVLARGRTRRVDLGRASGPGTRLFANVAVGGFGGRVEGRVGREAKRRWGPLAYFRAAAEEMARPKRYELSARLDDEEVELEALHVIVANGSRAGGNIPVAPSATLDDGRLDVIIVPALELPQLLGLIPAFLSGEHPDDERLLTRRVRTATFRSEPAMPFGTDGEPIGTSPLDFRVLPAALEVVC